MGRQARRRALLGFFMGALMGLGLSFLGGWLGNIMLKIKGLPPETMQWWDFLPMTLFLGLAMAALMVHPPFGMED